MVMMTENYEVADVKDGTACEIVLKAVTNEKDRDR